jgi:hypothetical protein
MATSRRLRSAEADLAKRVFGATTLPYDMILLCDNTGLGGSAVHERRAVGENLAVAEFRCVPSSARF